MVSLSGQNLTLLLIAIVLVSGCAYKAPVAQQTAPVETSDVEIKNFAFSPSVTTVSKGTTVTWTNLDSAPHTVTSSGKFDSGSLAQGKSWSFTFNEAGEFDYICTIHPYMKGKIIVK